MQWTTVIQGYFEQLLAGHTADTAASTALSAAVANLDADVVALQADATEIETHVHSYERWFAAAGTPDAELHVADRVGVNNAAFQIDGGGGAGTGSWGAWVQILGSTDTPAELGKTYYDLHKLIVTAAERANTIYLIQIGFGESGAAALTAGEYTEIVYRAGAAVTREASVLFQATRHPATAKAWARCWAVGADTGTLSFLVGLHEYAE